MDMQRVVDDMVRSGIKSRTIQGYVRQLNTILRAAMDDYHLISEPPTEELTLKIDKEKYYLVVLLALKCELRLGEILGLTWDNINDKNKTIRIEKQWKQITETEYGF